LKGAVHAFNVKNFYKRIKKLPFKGSLYFIAKVMWDIDYYSPLLATKCQFFI